MASTTQNEAADGNSLPWVSKFLDILMKLGDLESIFHCTMSPPKFPWNLLYQFLGAFILGFSTRWVVEWAKHKFSPKPTSTIEVRGAAKEAAELDEMMNTEKLD